MATSNKSKKILEKARKVAAKTKKKKVSKAEKTDVKKKTTFYPEGQNAPQSKKYTQESDKTLSAKATGWRWTKEGAKKVGKPVESKPTTSDIEKYRNETFKLKGKPNKSGPKGVGDGSHRYLYVERRADKADITRKNKLEDGGEMAKGGEVKKGDVVKIQGKDFKVVNKFDSMGTKKYFLVPTDDTKDKYGFLSAMTLTEKELASNTQMARGGKIPSDEVAYFKNYVKDFYGEGEIYSEFFPPVGVSSKEVNLAVNQYIDYCKTKDDLWEWRGGDSFDREIVRDIMLYNRGTKKGLEYQRAIKEIFGKDKKEYGGILQPMTGGVNADPRFDIYNTTMFAERGAELAKGGRTHEINIEDGDDVKFSFKKKTLLEIYESDDSELDNPVREIFNEGEVFEVTVFGIDKHKYDVQFGDGSVAFIRKADVNVIEVNGEKYSKGGKLSDTFKKAYDYGDTEGYIRDFGSVELEVKGKDKEIKLVALAKISNIYDATGDEQFEKTPYEVAFQIVPTLKHIDKKHIESAMDSSGVDELSSINYGDIFEGYMSGVPLTVDGETFKLFATYDEAKDYIYSKEVNNDITVSSRLVGFALDRPVNRIGTTGWSYLTNIVDENHDPYKFAKGGSTHEQGYDDREDESLAMRHGKIARKHFVGSHARREHSRRDDAHFETRHKRQ